MSAKNTLQEYCQKNNLPLPIYLTVRVSDTRDSPLFESTTNFNQVTYRGLGTNKTAAEQDTAKQVCQILPQQSSVKQNQPLSISQKYPNPMAIPMSQYGRIYLIDGDNCHVTDEKLFDVSDSLYMYIIARNNTHPQPLLHQQKYSNCCVFVSETISRDAVDHLLTFFLGQLSITQPDKHYYVVTKDHFGECLESFMSNCKLVCSL
jgi:hypothetical protein